MGTGYTLIGLIGKGNSSEVWQAEDRLGNQVGIRFCDGMDNDQTRFALEGLSLVSDLHHPHILPMHSYGFDDKNLYVITELADSNLSQRFRQDCASRVRSAIVGLVSCIYEAALALDFMHGSELVHGSISPRSILVINDQAKLSDFFLTHKLTTRLPQFTQVSPNLESAPELLSGECNRYTDQYALAHAFAKVRFGDVDFLSPRTMPKTAQQNEFGVLARALSRVPNDRFESCREFAEALRATV